MNTDPFQGLGIGYKGRASKLNEFASCKSAFEYEPKPELQPWGQYTKISHTHAIDFTNMCSILSLGRQHGFVGGDCSIE